MFFCEKWATIQVRCRAGQIAGLLAATESSFFKLWFEICQPSDSSNDGSRTRTFASNACAPDFMESRHPAELFR